MSGTTEAYLQARSRSSDRESPRSLSGLSSSQRVNNHGHSSRACRYGSHVKVTFPDGNQDSNNTYFQVVSRKSFELWGLAAGQKVLDSIRLKIATWDRTPAALQSPPIPAPAELPTMVPTLAPLPSPVYRTVPVPIEQHGQQMS